MYYALGPDECLRTLLALSTPFLPDGRIDLTSLRSGYLGYLSSYQPDIARFRAPHAKVVTEPDRIRHLADVFGLEDTPPGKRSGFEDRRDPTNPMPTWKLRLLEDGLEELREAEPGMRSLFDIAIDSIFSTANSLAAGSMTTGRAVGIIWVDPLKGWNEYDAAEAYAHELTHTLLTLDEHRYGHFPNYAAMREPKNLAKSAIRSERRPLNAVVHSYVVAEELLSLRAQGLPPDFTPRLHADTATLHAKAGEARRSIYECRNLEALTTERLRSILARADERFDSIPDPVRASAKTL